MALFTFVALALTSLAFSEISATSNTTLKSSDGAYKLQWRYNNSQLIFTLTCETTGYCAVAFSETADGKNMVRYDIAVTGYASGAGYVDVSKSSIFFLISSFFYYFCLTHKRLRIFCQNALAGNEITHE